MKTHKQELSEDNIAHLLGLNLNDSKVKVKYSGRYGNVLSQALYMSSMKAPSQKVQKLWSMLIK